MDRKQSVILGVAGAIATAVLFGGLAIHNMRSDGELASGSRTDENSYLQDADSASNKMDDDSAKILEYGKSKEKLLNSLVFYQGTATIQENYTMVSGVSGDTPVIGSVAMVSEDIMVYDPSTENCYLVARRIALLGDNVKDFEFARIYSGSATTKVTGILTEYYGNGVLHAYDEADALAGNKGYYLSFLANPVRIDCTNEIVFTNPPVKRTYWVQVIGGDEVTMVATGVFTPEELPSVNAGLIPGMSSVTGERTYNQSETLIYEYTGGKVIPKGTFYYDFKKSTYGEIKDFLIELKEEAQKDVLLEDASETLSSAWKETVAATNDMNVLADASTGLKSYTDYFAGGSAADASKARNEADMLANGAEFHRELARAFEALDGLEAEDGSLRNLEDFCLDGGEGDKRDAADAMGSLLPVLKEYLAQYRLIISSLRENTDELSACLSGDSPQQADADPILLDIRTQIEELKRLSTCLESMSSEIYSLLLSYDANEEKNETEFAVLARLCGMWEETLDEFMAGTAPIVDVEDGISIPDDYPAHIVPLLKSAVAAIYEVQDDSTISLTLKTGMTVNEVIVYYKSALKDVKNLSAFEMSGMATLSGETGGYELSILATANQLGGGEITMVQIILIPA